MTKVIIIIGLLEKNSGKTFIAKNLAHYLKDEYFIVPFKPISGSNYWYHPENTKYLLKNRTLISQDLRRVTSFLNNISDFPLTILNPVHSLFHHTNLNSILRGETSFEEIEQTSYWSTDKPILIRYSLWEEDLQKEKRVHVVLENSIPESLEDAVGNAEEIFPYNSLEELATLDKELSTLALDSCFNYLLKKIKNQSKKPLLLIEGFNNIVPLSSMIHQSSTILIVAPGKIAVTNVDRFKKTQKFLMNEFLPVDKYLSHSVVKGDFSIPFNPNENDWYQIIANIKEII
ncbi:MAG: hypothetical protein ACW981_10320 [Candidatus Hodarchaeales archaeon]|jgi:predicted P-loop ATPase/GTPase